MMVASDRSASPARRPVTTTTGFGTRGIVLKSPSEIAVMRRAGEVLAGVMERLPAFIRPGVSTLAIDTQAEAFIRRRGAVPAFKGYHGFPATTCVSINAEVVHGIPSVRRRVAEGDIVSVDVGCVVDGYYADCATTLAVGEIPKATRTLLEVTRGSLDVAIESCHLGRRLSDVSHAVQTYVESHGLAVVRGFVGHGIGRALHEEPEVPNFGAPGHGPRLCPGMVLAIEPMVTMGAPDVLVLDDGWTAVTRDGSLSAHFEDTVALTEHGPVVLTRAARPTPR
jgi:methionyl aminopeptidase